MTGSIQSAFDRAKAAVLLRKAAGRPPKCGMPVTGDEVLGTARTIKTAEEHARKLLGKGGSVSYEGMDLAYANGLNLKLADLKKRFGLKIRRISQKSNWTDVAGNQIQGQHFKKEITLNSNLVSPKGIKGLTKDLAKDFKKGFRASARTDDLLTHEYGHAVFNSLSKVQQAQVLEWQISSGFFGQIGSQVSRYAERNTLEFFAESFVKVADGTAPQPVMQLFRKLRVLK